jgi:hypothetical protein
MSDTEQKVEQSVSETVKQLVKLRDTVARYYQKTPWRLDEDDWLSRLYCACVRLGYIPYLVDEVTIALLADITTAVRSAPRYLEIGGGLLSPVGTMLTFIVVTRQENPDWQAVVEVIQQIEQHIETKFGAKSIINYEPVNGTASLAFDTTAINIDSVLRLVTAPLVYWNGGILIHKTYRPDWFGLLCDVFTRKDKS